MTSLYFDQVPKDHIANLKWRLYCRERALKDKRFRDALWQACMDDVCFFMGFACVGKGTRVVTERGPVPIELVKQNDRVWDGVEWVFHQGVLRKGRKSTILAYEIRVTPDHEIWTKHGWKPAIQGHDRADVRLAPGYQEEWKLPEYDESGMAVSLPVRERNNGSRRQSSSRKKQKLQMPTGRQGDAREDWNEHLSSLDAHDSEMHESEECSVEALWWTRYSSVQTLVDVRELPGRHGGAARRPEHRPDQQRRQLRAWQLSVGNMVAADTQPASEEDEEVRYREGADDHLRDHGRDRLDASSSLVPHQSEILAGTTTSSVERTAEVYDILNCGPRQCFTVLDAEDRPLLVHNCWGYDPRANLKVVPFIPYPHQVQVFQALDQAIDDSTREGRTIDVILDKARAQGGTFGYLWVDLRRWLRDRMFSAGYVTRNESLVDSKTDSNTVLWKIQWAIDMLPVWMQPNYERNLAQHTFWNKDNGSLLRGYAAGQDVAAGGRATIFTCDEFGAKDFIAAGKDESVMEALHDVTGCLSAGTLVVTDSGLVPIEAIPLDSLVWDGTMWVSHGGCVYQGEQATISAYEIRMTQDHEVLTVEGWKDAGQRFERAEVRLPRGYAERWFNEERTSEMVVSVPVWQAEADYWGQANCQETSDKELRLPERQLDFSSTYYARHDRNTNLRVMGKHAQPLHQSIARALPRLRWPRDHGVLDVANLRGFSGGHGRSSRREGTGEARQRQGILQGELLLGDATAASKQPPQQSMDSNVKRTTDSSAGRENRGHYPRGNSVSQKKGSVRRRLVETEAVYDLVNCGPRQAFTVIGSDGRPLLVHNCIRMVSARYADSGVFHEACENPDTRKNGVYLVLDWKDHPVHGKNSYVVQNGKPVARKPEEAEAVANYHADKPDLRARLERKGFKFDGVVRSPWYDMRCLRPTATPRLIASQLDRNPRGAVGKCFPTDLLDRMKRECCKQPVWQGQPVLDSETLALIGLIQREDGPLKLWFKPGLDNTPPLGPFTLTCDIALGGDGAYSSNSVASGLDDRTGEQVLEYAVKGMDPIKFADVTVGLAKWLWNALLGWEDSGMSGGFAKQVMEVRYYGNIFFRDVTQLGSQKKSRKPGWPCRDADKAEMFEKLTLAMETGKYIPRSEAMIVECGEYEWDNGSIIHAPTKNRGAKEKNHGDRCIAGSGCWLVFSTDNVANRIDTDEENGQIPEYGSFLWREQRELRSSKAGTPGFGILDLIGGR